MANLDLSLPADEEESPRYLLEALRDAERLLKYAAETGIDIDPETRLDVLRARSADPGDWTEEVTAKLLIALTRLADRLRPVTAASLEACRSKTGTTMHAYLVWAIILSVVIIPVSILTFVTSNISDSIRTDITKANALSVKLRAELGPPVHTEVGANEEIADLQEYAGTVRSIYTHSKRLNRLVFPHVEVPQPLLCPDLNTADQAACLKRKFELPVQLTDLPAARDNIVQTYQDVRFFAQSITNDIITFYSAINSCILPILYALLGTCAFLLRSFEDQMSNRTFIPTVANSARFVIAAIGGTVIGLFTGYTAQASASPLAIAFLVGYGVEIFFTFLEGLIRSFTKGVSYPSTSLPTSSKT